MAGVSHERSGREGRSQAGKALARSTDNCASLCLPATLGSTAQRAGDSRKISLTAELCRRRQLLVLLIDIRHSLSRPINRDQVQTVSTTLEQLMTGEGNQAAASPEPERSFDPNGA